MGQDLKPLLPPPADEFQRAVTAASAADEDFRGPRRACALKVEMATKGKA